MELNPASIREVAGMLFGRHARQAFGDQGDDYLSRLLNGVREFFQTVPPDGLSTTFVFLYRVSGPSAYELDDNLEQLAASLAIRDVPGYRRRIEDVPVLVIEIRRDGLYDLAATPESLQLERLSEHSLVFTNERGVDRFVIAGRSTDMPPFVTGARSNFAVPTISDLEEALEKYRREAANVSCPLLADVWVGGRDGPRLVFKNKPESTMRRSLERFLATSMNRNVSVRPEHNTDESHPVDLVVNWFGVRQRALIEVKWLGKSLTGSTDGRRVTTYSDSRAHEGAGQLAGYLDRERSTDPEVALRGYLAVFDGRRRRVVDACTPISPADAWFFENREISLTGNPASEQLGMAPMFRYFLEPGAPPPSASERAS
ncbi:MAG: hypothetical protein OXI49_18305 [Acidobacteriota bacterium]|nr:hypothetical protein [Acidobacteriota bacterium]